jgi:hypothetical protein
MIPHKHDKLGDFKAANAKDRFHKTLVCQLFDIKKGPVTTVHCMK